MKTRSMLVALALGLVTLFSQVARADTAAAKQAFESAAQAYREGRYPEAVQLFLQAYEEDHQPQLIYNAAQAYEKAGDVPNALRSYRRFLRLAPDADDRPTVELRVRNLERRLREKGVQQVSVFSTPDGASLEIDGKAAGKTPWSAEIAPGTHVVVLRHEGFPDVTKEIVHSADHSLELDVTLGASTATPARADASAPPASSHQVTGATTTEPAADAATERSIRPLTWAAFGVGVAALGASVGFELARASAEQDARDAPTQVEHRDRYDTMKSRQTTARVLAGVGVAGAAAGGVLLYVDLSRKPRPTTRRARLQLGCGALGCGAFAHGSF